MQLQNLLPTLQRQLRLMPGLEAIEAEQLEPLPTTGLAHDHVRVSGTGLLLRVPKQSQLGLDAVGNLHYQAACFERAAASGHTPKLHAVLAPVADLSMGALLVDEITGPVVMLPQCLPAVAGALAAIHALPMPPPGERPPLKNPADALADTVAEVQAQAEYLEAANLDLEALWAIRQELASAAEMLTMPYRPPTTLISFDAHPGNFLLDSTGRAVLVDLEKARYGAPGFDLAHASLYTSTTWDVASYAELDTREVADFYRCWLEAVPQALAETARPWLLPLRRVMWLWSVTWCAKWRVQSARTAKTAKQTLVSTEDWSAELSTPQLVEHVAGRVTDYLRPEIIRRVRDEWLGSNALTELLG